MLLLSKEVITGIFWRLEIIRFSVLVRIIPFQISFQVQIFPFHCMFSVSPYGHPYPCQGSNTVIIMLLLKIESSKILAKVTWSRIQNPGILNDSSRSEPHKSITFSDSTRQKVSSMNIRQLSLRTWELNVEQHKTKYSIKI